MVLHEHESALPGHIWCCLETLVVTTWVGGVAIGNKWVEATQHPTVCVQERPPNRMRLPKRSTVPRLSCPALESEVQTTGPF